MEYKKITEVELIEEPSENATVLTEDDGKLRRVPFKKVGGNGGGLPSGGEPHQMLVTDADGKTVWEERTHYTNTVVVNIPQTTVNGFTNNNGRYITTSIPDVIEEKAIEIARAAALPTSETDQNISCTVVFDGETYETKGVAGMNGEAAAVVFGNLYFQSGSADDDTGEPFCFMMYGSMSGIMTTIEGSEHSVSAELRTAELYQLEPKYIPDLPYVSYAKSQEEVLTDGEKQQARWNIGAGTCSAGSNWMGQFVQPGTKSYDNLDKFGLVKYVGDNVIGLCSDGDAFIGSYGSKSSAGKFVSCGSMSLNFAKDDLPSYGYNRVVATGLSNPAVRHATDEDTEYTLILVRENSVNTDSLHTYICSQPVFYIDEFE